MRRVRISAGIALAALLLCPALVRGESAQRLFANGKARLAKGDFQNALKSYAAAAQTDRGNQEYRSQYMLLRQAVDMRHRLEAEKDPKRWEYFARALHSYYTSQGIYPEVLALDQKIYARLKTPSAAATLAETQLAMNLNTEAVQTLQSVSPRRSTPSSQALLGIGLARTGKVQEARQIAENVTLPDTAGPGMTYTVARLHAAVGSSAEALRLLTRCFETVAPSRQEGFKAHAKQSTEFAGLASTAEFAEVLETRSKVPESKCSGGSSCAGCPMRGKCAKSQTK